MVWQGYKGSHHSAKSNLQTLLFHFQITRLDLFLQGLQQQQQPQKQPKVMTNSATRRNVMVTEMRTAVFLWYHQRTVPQYAVSIGSGFDSTLIDGPRAIDPIFTFASKKTLSVSFPSPSWSSTFTNRPALARPPALYVKPGTGISSPEVNTWLHSTLSLSTLTSMVTVTGSSHLFTFIFKLISLSITFVEHVSWRQSSVILQPEISIFLHLSFFARPSAIFSNRSSNGLVPESFLDPRLPKTRLTTTRTITSNQNWRAILSDCCCVSLLQILITSFACLDSKQN